MESMDLVRFWAIAVLASLPTSPDARLAVVQNSFETIQRAARTLFVVVPDYAAQCKVSIQVFANVLMTVQHHVRRGSPAGPVEVIEATMPASTYNGRYSGPAMRTLIMHTGHRKVFREVRNGMWELQDRAQILEQPGLEGSRRVVVHLMSFAEDVLYACRELNAQPLAERTCQETPRQTPDVLD